MQLFKNRSHYLIVDGEHCLWCSRFDGSLEAKTYSSIADLRTLDFLCLIENVVGKIQIFPDSEPKLILILGKSTAATISGNKEIFRIDKVGILALSPADPVADDRLLFSGRKDVDASDVTGKPVDTYSESSLILMNRGVQKTLKTLRQAANFSLGSKPSRKERSDRDKLERRILEDLCKMFNNSQSFYYSVAWDLTNTMQRLFRQRIHAVSPRGQPDNRWRASDDRFFWNRDLWKELATSGTVEDDHWITPVVQGCVQLEEMVINLNTFVSNAPDHSAAGEYVQSVSCNVILISRRSRFRAGTRYKRRGTDERGNCANYVETEQILEIMGHSLSFVQVRGSVPVYWSQPGMRYRPSPRLDRSEKENHMAFAIHFNDQLKVYKHQVLVNLVEQTGREKILADAYLNGILQYDSESLVYVSFDFHEHCRGLRLENIAVLVQSMHEVFQGMRFFWCKTSDVSVASEEQLMCHQRSVFRINCVDCLDRTNVVQASFARFVLEAQLRKMGLLLPDVLFPVDCKQILQTMWANNGDVISRQYAGTSALKSDFTRTGERKFTGMMKDGYTSANRYYLNQFKDAYRQAAVDASLGSFFQEESILLPGVAPSTMDPSESERVKQLVDDSKRILIPDTEVALGGWPLADADSRTGNPVSQDMDTVLLLSTQAYYVGEYSDETDQLVGYQRVSLVQLDGIEVGNEVSVFRGGGPTIIRFNYHIDEVRGYCHQFNTSGLRFFNNMIMHVTTEDDSIEMLRSIGESFRMALESQHGIVIPVSFGTLQRKVSKVPPKKAAPRESEGGIFTAAPIEAPSVEASKSHIGDVLLSAVKTKLAGLNPMHRLHFNHRRNRSAGSQSMAKMAYSKDTDKAGIVPAISVQSPTASPPTSENSDSESLHESMSDSETGTGHLSTLEEKTSTDVESGRKPVTTSLSQRELCDSVLPVDKRRRSEQPPETQSLRLATRQRQLSRSSETLEKDLIVLNPPLTISASPSVRAFHDDAEQPSTDLATKSGWTVSESDNDSMPPITNVPKVVLSSSTISPTGSMRMKSSSHDLKSIKDCRTPIIQL